MRGFKFLDKDKISQLPKTPGVYAFKKDARLLYIGKATNIRERVKNHFHPVKYREAVILPRAKLFNRVKQIGYIKTDSEIGALILEANLIKKYQPKYNVVWRDDKNYFFVGITREDFPQVFWTHQTKLSKYRNVEMSYVGPFVDGKALKQTLKVLRKVFPYRSCKNLPKRPCLWYQLSRCPAPCLMEANVARISQQNAQNLVKILQGKKIWVLKSLKREMKDASKIQDFEKAAKIRNQITALEKVLAHARLPEPAAQTAGGQAKIFEWNNIQKILGKILKTKKKIARIEAYDVSNIQGQLATGAMVTFINGFPDKNFYRRFKIKMTGEPNDVAMIKEILSRRFGHQEWELPDLILIDGGKPQLNVAVNSKSQIPNGAQPKAGRVVGGLESKKIRVIAIAKKKNELYIESQKKPILLKSLPREIFNLILQLRDEAHRFAITYHRKLREIDLRPNF